MGMVAQVVKRIGGEARERLFPKRAGSGLPARPIIRVLVWARRIVQTGCLGLFTWLLLRTGFGGTFHTDAERVRVGLPVEGYLLADPFVAAITLLSTRTVYR